MRKIKSLSAVALSVLIIAAMTVPAFASNIPNGLSDEEVMEYIMTGNGYYVGEGAPVSEFDNLLPQTKWGSGEGATHQYVTTYGLTILENERSAAYNWLEDLASVLIIIDNADWPDTSETDGITFRGHFYSQDRSQTSTTALTRFTQHYEDALEYYDDGLYTNCFQELGRALHYLEDASTPVHVAADFYAAPSHALYENYVNDHLSSYRVTSGGRYSDMGASNTYEDIFETVSAYAYDYLPEDSIGSGADYSASRAIPRTMQNVAGLLYRFYNDCR